MRTDVEVEGEPVPTEQGNQGAEGAEATPWVLRLGNYLTKGKKEQQQEEDNSTPWAVKLGTYLKDRQPGPWSIIANEKPHDPLVHMPHPPMLAAPTHPPLTECVNVLHNRHSAWALS